MGPEHSVLRYNLSLYLLNGVPWHMLGDGSAREVARDLDDLPIAPRWQMKLERDLAQPYTDREVIEALTAKERQLGRAVRRFRELAGGRGDAELYLMGGVLKGRFGPNSDIDLVIDSDDAFVDRVMKSEYGAHNPDAEEFRVGSYAYASARGEHYGPFLNLGTLDQIDQHAHPLLDAFQRGLRDKGIELSLEDGSVRYDPASIEPATEADQVAARILEYEKAYRQVMDTSVMLRYADADIDERELVAYTREHMVEMGRSLAKRFFDCLDAPRLREHLESRGERADWDSSALAEVLTSLDPEALCDLAGLVEPLERLAFILAGLEDAKETGAATLFEAERERAAGRLERATPLEFPHPASLRQMTGT